MTERTAEGRPVVAGFVAALPMNVPAGLAARSPTARAVILGWRGPYGAACVNPTGIVSYEHPHESPLLKGEEGSQPPM